LLIRILKTIKEHMVMQHAITQAIARASGGQHMRRIGHRLHAASDGDVDRTGQQFVMRDHHRLLR